MFYPDRFPDIEVLSPDDHPGDLRIRLVTDKASQWVARMCEVPLESVAHRIVRIPNDDLLVDAYQDGLVLYSKSKGMWL